ncbi:MAG: hypothetical protein AB7F43_09785 [Bacteriovoracia bacterium]
MNLTSKTTNKNKFSSWKAKSASIVLTLGFGVVFYPLFLKDQKITNPEDLNTSAYLSAAEVKASEFEKFSMVLAKPKNTASKIREQIQKEIKGSFSHSKLDTEDSVVLFQKLENSKSLEQNQIDLKKKFSDLEFKYLSKKTINDVIQKEIRSDLARVIPLSLVLMGLVPIFVFQSVSVLFCLLCVGIWSLLPLLYLHCVFFDGISFQFLAVLPFLMCILVVDTLFFWQKTSEVGSINAVKQMWKPTLISSGKIAVALGAFAVATSSKVFFPFCILMIIGLLISKPLIFLFSGIFSVQTKVSKSSTRFFSEVIRKKGVTPILMIVVIVFVGASFFTEYKGLLFDFGSSLTEIKNLANDLSPAVFVVRSKKTLPVSLNPNEKAFIHFLFVDNLKSWLEQEKGLHGKPFVSKTLTPSDLVDQFSRSFGSSKTTNLRSSIEKGLKLLKTLQLDFKEIEKESFGFLRAKSKNEIESIQFLAWIKPMNLKEVKKFEAYLENYGRTMMGDFEFSVSGPWKVKKLIEKRSWNEALEAFLLAVLSVLLISIFLKKRWALFVVINLLPVFISIGGLRLLGRPLTVDLLIIPTLLLALSVKNSMYGFFGVSKKESLVAANLMLGASVAGCFVSSIPQLRVFGTAIFIGCFAILVLDLYLVNFLDEKKNPVN